MKALKLHIEDQIANAKQAIKDSIDQNGKLTRTVVIESNHDTGAFQVDLERIYAEWGVYLGISSTSQNDEDEFQTLLLPFYNMVSTLFQEFYKEMELVYPGGDVVGSATTKELIDMRKNPEDLKTLIFMWVADKSNYQSEPGEILEGVARFENMFVYTPFDLGIIMSPVNGLPEVVDLSSDDEPDPALQGLPQPGAAGSSQPPSAGAQGFMDAKEQRKRQKLKEEQMAREAAAAEAAAREAARKKAAAEQAAAQPEPGAAVFQGDPNAAEFEIDEYGDRNGNRESDSSVSDSESDS